MKNWSLNLDSAKGSTLCQTGLSSLFMCWVVFVDVKGNDGWTVVSALMLHSGQSYPDIPEQPGSKTDTHPDERKKINETFHMLK